MREAVLQQRIISRLQEQGAWVFKVVGSPRQRRGVPDILCCWHGKFLAIEVKTPRGIVSPLQQRELDAIRLAGGRAIVVTDLEQVTQSSNSQMAF